MGAVPNGRVLSDKSSLHCAPRGKRSAGVGFFGVLIWLGVVLIGDWRVREPNCGAAGVWETFLAVSARSGSGRDG